MPERRQIVELWQRGDAVALATLVRVEGSSYRRIGARLLVAANGDYAGSISGGCLEAEVIRKAQWLTRNSATVQRYSTLFDDTADVPYGLGCGGTVDVLLEPANTPEFTALMQAMQASLLGGRRRVITGLPTATSALSRQILTTNLYAPDPDSRTGVEAPHRSASRNRDEAESAFDEQFDPPHRLFIFGAGDDAQPMVRMAALLGWSVLVIDGRAQWARAERFPEATQVLTASTLDGITIDESDSIVVMTHSYEQDRGWLAATLPSQPRYLGLLGSRHRSALLISEVSAMLGWSLERACESIFAPVGLDLGGDGAEAIALSAIAEIQASREGRLGVSRRMSPETIFEQIAQGGASRYLQLQCAV
jgi:xanthine dehydrogenase accessory factor